MGSSTAFAVGDESDLTILSSLAQSGINYAMVGDESDLTILSSKLAYYTKAQRVGDESDLTILSSLKTYRFYLVFSLNPNYFSFFGFYNQSESRLNPHRE